MKEIQLIVIIISFCIYSCQAQKKSIPRTSKVISEKSSPISDWKTYSSNRMGISFEYPDTWIKDEKESEAINITGVVTAIEISFRDTATQTVFFVSHHLAPSGAELYKYAFSQFQTKQGWYANNSGRKINLAGNVALQAIDTISKNGKGYQITPQLKSIVVDVLDNTQVGAFELQFKTPLSISKVEEAKLERLFATFRFVN